MTRSRPIGRTSPLLVSGSHPFVLHRGVDLFRDQTVYVGSRMNPVEEVVARVRTESFGEKRREIHDGNNMEILAFTLDPADINATLRALRNNGVDPRAGPWTARAPPLHAA